jgi:hypothetical protein
MHDFYHACQLGKHARLPFPSSVSRTAKPFDLVHCDLWISTIVSSSGSKYYLAILDDFSYYLWTFPLRLKSDTFTTLSIIFACLYSVQLHNSECPVRQWEKNSTMHPHGPFYSPTSSYCACHTHTLPYKMVKLSTLSAPSIMLFVHCFSKLPCQHTNGSRAHIATYLLNRLPTKMISASCPYVGFGSPPSYKHLHVFGSACYPNLSAIALNKLPAPHSIWCVFLRYSSDHKGSVP